MGTIATIGHSTHPIEHFVGLLRMNGVTAVADVRSTPFSRRNPQFNREALQADLGRAGIAYVHLGRELGARSPDPEHYEGGRISYERLAESARFQEGIARVIDGAARHRIALMCAERDPIICHRTILVSRALVRRGVAVEHILADGRIEPHADAMDRLVRELNLDPDDLFVTDDDLHERAYQAQGRRMAPARPDSAAD
ncbi:DUF488 domain-containing protein [Consotaella aegiceratis]|uniref:DUF488 domain-containing protein n=1 Tax=Consotaella aegiceratis TaxID=3097961 RepID=UPI002F415B80